MRREIDELFGDVFERSTGLRGRGFSPSVDVFYRDDPPRAIVKADLAGVDIENVALEIRGRKLLIAGERRSAEAEGSVYQQIEIEHGHFRRLVVVGVDVGAEGGGGGAGGGGCGRGGGSRARGRPPPGRDPARSARGAGAPRADRRGRARVSIHVP